MMFIHFPHYSHFWELYIEDNEESSEKQAFCPKTLTTWLFMP